MNSINGIIAAVFILLYSPLVNISAVQAADKMSPSDMMRSNSTKIYKPINHDNTVSFSLWKQKIKSSLIRKPDRKTSKR